MPFCIKCGKKLGLLSHKYESEDGWIICDSCFEKWQDEQARNKKIDLGNFSKLNGHEFELDLKKMFEHLGYTVLETPASENQGADLILSKDEEKIVVQTKKYDEKVSDKAVQEIIAAKNHYKADKARIVTYSPFTSSALDLALNNEVELWDGKKIRDIVKSLERNEKEKGLSVRKTYTFTEGKDIQEITMVCPMCEEEFKVEINIKETDTFKVECPHCGGTLKGKIESQ
ncbi:MAG: restriction endonuclease [Thermoplasmatales archaeon]|nr:MAG: restriction endonuclease [Thermoplasmatales archaeon]